MLCYPAPNVFTVIEVSSGVLLSTWHLRFHLQYLDSSEGKVVSHLWGGEKLDFGIEWVDEDQITIMKDLEIWYFKH